MTRDIDPHAMTVEEYERLLKHALAALAGVRGKRALAAREEAIGLLTNMTGRLIACLKFCEHLRSEAIVCGRAGLMLDGRQIDRVDLLLDGLPYAVPMTAEDLHDEDERTVIA